MAACTSRAAALMSRLRSNCSVIPVAPSVLADVISLTAAIRPNWRSSGVATADAMVSGLAPGNPALTEIVGKSTCGSGDTGSKRKAAMPDSASAIASNVVATGLRMNGSEIFIASLRRNQFRSRAFLGPPRETPCQAIEPQINHGSRVERQQLAKD